MPILDEKILLKSWSLSKKFGQHFVDPKILLRILDFCDTILAWRAYFQMIENFKHPVCSVAILA